MSAPRYSGRGASARSGPPEILAPAGSPEKLRTALRFGADAVYLGLKRGSLRALAPNFSLDELAWALGYARERGRRVYVCLNLQPFDEDMGWLEDTLRDLARLGPDGLILADPGVLALARREAPGIPCHLSTQASVTSAAAARFWFEQGISRIVLARELSLAQLGALVKGAARTGRELEVFVHGAVCLAYSGRCLLSLYWAGRGGSEREATGAARDPRRGTCAQACRWPFARMAVEDARQPGDWHPLEEDHRGTHFFDARDLCALPVLDALLEAGVGALKIEGRTRSAHYVGVTVDVYRHAVDRLAAGDLDGFRAGVAAYLAELGRPTTRGFSTHFLTGEQDRPESYNRLGSYPDGRHGFVGQVTGSDGGGLWVTCRNAVARGDRLEIRDRGLVCEQATLHRIDTPEEGGLPAATHGSVIRIPGAFRSGPGALVRRAPGERPEDAGQED